MGAIANKLPSPKPPAITTLINPAVIPKICGIVRIRPKFAPDAASIILFGPGVKAAMVAKMAKADM